jgi:hypothetical protein
VVVLRRRPLLRGGRSSAGAVTLLTRGDRAYAP